MNFLMTLKRLWYKHIFVFLVSLTVLPPGDLLSFSVEPWWEIDNF